jgi:hypothetical protein
VAIAPVIRLNQTFVQTCNSMRHRTLWQVAFSMDFSQVSFSAAKPLQCAVKSAGPQRDERPARELDRSTR